MEIIRIREREKYPVFSIGYSQQDFQIHWNYRSEGDYLIFIYKERWSDTTREILEKELHEFDEENAGNLLEEIKQNEARGVELSSGRIIYLSKSQFRSQNQRYIIPSDFRRLPMRVEVWCIRGNAIWIPEEKIQGEAVVQFPLEIEYTQKSPLLGFGKNVVVEIYSPANIPDGAIYYKLSRNEYNYFIPNEMICHQGENKKFTIPLNKTQEIALFTVEKYKEKIQIKFKN